ncbi:MAG TPA: hypothetical protein VHB79_14580 [Polyangiaceae bacterium]|nr:hypothetical protein [Polyangiaceae bacterium]
MLRSLVLALCAGALLAPTLGCSDQEVVAQLRSLSASEDALFLCRDDAGNGHPYAECPDRDTTDDLKPGKHLSIYALVSQTLSDEVAVIDVSSGNVVDADPSTPGFGFLRVGGRPVAMATTPGGTASFVATADVGRNGLFALPTSCLGAPAAGEPPRDLTTWPACRLPQTPGEIAMVVQPFGDRDCDQKYVPKAEASDDATCQADLANDGGVEGRRLLLVSFPDTGEVAVVDAQKVLDTVPGEFPDCDIETIPRLSLKAEIPAGITQTLPPDLQTQCTEVPPPSAPVPSAMAPRPAGFALSDGKLYIADRAAPVIHVVDTSDACNLTELPSLLPMSLREPERMVTTRRVAVSPLTPGGKRFVYAIDAEDRPFASVMAFDVSPGSTDPTPIVRSGAPELPGEKPDRLSLDGPARDVTFAYRDIPYVDPDTGAAQFGDRCNPDPALDTKLPAALARPSTDLSLGARPGLLRGLFGFILQTDGKIAVIDVDDFDADCRRPATVGESFRGCQGDLWETDFTGSQPGAIQTDDNSHQLVTGEVSCRVVEPNRIRSAHPIVNNTSSSAAREPSLRTFPQLTVPSTAPTADSVERPRLLAVPFEEKGAFVDAEVLIGASVYSTNRMAAQQLETNPNGRDSELMESQNAVILPPLEPRSYASESRVQVVYEGSYAGNRNAGFWDELQEGDQGSIALRDDSLSFCSAGVYDQAAMADYGQNELGLRSEDAAAFGVEHADYVQITSDFPAVDDPEYWSYLNRDRDASLPKASRERCDALFLAWDADPLSKSRNLKIVSAFDGRLVLTPVSKKIRLRDFQECFPGAMTYRLRAGGHWVVLHNDSFIHDIVASGSNSACVRSCSPLKKWSKGRVFEISSSADNCRKTDDPGDPLELRVGCAAEGEVACVYDQGPKGKGRGVSLADAAARCIFNGLNERFALYRGRVETPPDATFTWQTTGGFTPLIMSMGQLSSSVSPQSIQYLGPLEDLAVVDGTNLGLTLFSLDTFSVVKPSPFY